MKKVLLILFATCIISISYAENPGNYEAPARSNTAVSGVVMDKSSGEFLTGVKVIIEGTEKVIYTDFDGTFSIGQLEPGTYDITLELISYNERKLEDIVIDPRKKDDLKITLEPSTVDLASKPN